MTYQRARKPEAKDERRRQLKDAARAVLDDGVPVAQATIASVATRAGLAKGTAYLYFSTKEALFVEVLAEDLGDWLATLAARLGTEGPIAAERFADAFADTLLERPRLIGLLTALHAVLEANLDTESARAFKTQLGRGLLAVDAAFSARLGFAPGEVAKLLVRVHALIVGLTGMATPPDAVCRALESPELAWMRVDLRTELVASITAMMRGWTA